MQLHTSVKLLAAECSQTVTYVQRNVKAQYSVTVMIDGQKHVRRKGTTSNWQYVAHNLRSCFCRIYVASPLVSNDHWIQTTMQCLGRAAAAVIQLQRSLTAESLHRACWVPGGCLASATAAERLTQCS